LPTAVRSGGVVAPRQVYASARPPRTRARDRRPALGHVS
jgi:hypothetical protein